MKFLVLGDTHGRPFWKKHIESTNPDKIIFIGDYFDNPEYTALEQLNNFLEIVQLKKERPDDVTLLIGNHDAHYMGIGQIYSGFQFGAFPNIEQILEEHKSLMQWCHSIDGILFTHAGVTKEWCKNNDIDLDSVVDSINALPVERFAFVGWEKHGDSTMSGPIWVRPKSLRENQIDGWKQVVGHTRQPTLIVDNSVILIDTMQEGLALLVNQEKSNIFLEISKIEM